MHKSLKCLSVLALCLLSLGLLLPSSAPAQTGTQPFRTPAWQISVETNSYVYPDGAGANWTYIKIGTSQTGKNVQAVFNWLDSNWAAVVSQSLNTNLWTNLFPTASTVQATFDYIDQTYRTNWSQAIADGLYIGRTNNAVVLANMGTSSVGAAAVVDGAIGADDLQVGMFGLLRGRTNESMDVNGNVTLTPQTSQNANPAVVTDVTVSNILVTKTTAFTFHGYLLQNSTARTGIDLLYYYIYVGASLDDSQKTRHDGAAIMGYVTNARASSFDNFSLPATVTFVVPQSNYYHIRMAAGSSLQDGGVAGYTSAWQLIRHTP